MRLNVLSLRPIGLFVGLALLVIGIEVIVVQSATFGHRPDWISLGVTIDIAVGLPVLYYFLLVRRFKLPIRTLLSVFGVSLALTALILPTNDQQLVSLLQRSLMLIEVGSVGYVLVRINQILGRYQQLSLNSSGFIENLTQSLSMTLGHSPFNCILVSEVSVVRYGLFGWAIPIEKTATETAFTSHRKSGHPAVMASLIGIGLVETLILHLVLDRWDSILAWWITAIGLYGLLFFAADAVATAKRPVLLRGHQIILRFGLRGYGSVDRQQIKTVTAISNKPDQDSITMIGTFFITPNVLITLHEPVVITGMLGWRKSVSRIALFIDDKQNFIHQLTA